MVGLYDKISEIRKVELVAINVLCISYLLSAPLFLLLKCRITCHYHNALEKKFYCENLCLETLQLKVKSYQKYLK